MIRLAVLLSLFISYAVPLILTPAGPVQLIENLPVRGKKVCREPFDPIGHYKFTLEKQP